MGMRDLVSTRLTSEKTESFPTSKNQEDNCSHNDISEIIDNHEWDDLLKIFHLLTIKNQVAKRQLTLIGKMYRKYDEQLLTKILTVWCNNKRRVGGVLISNKKTLVQNIALIVPTIDQYGSLKLWEHFAIDNR